MTGSELEISAPFLAVSRAPSPPCPFSPDRAHPLPHTKTKTYKLCSILLNVINMDLSVANVQWRAQDWLNFVIGTTTADPATCDPNSPPTSGVISAAFSGIDNLGFPAVYYDNATGLYLGYDMQGVLPGRGVVLGGAVLTQTRFARGACPGDFVGSSPASGGPAPNFTAFGLAAEGGGGGGIAQKREGKAPRPLGLPWSRMVPPPIGLLRMALCFLLAKHTLHLIPLALHLPRRPLFNGFCPRMMTLAPPFATAWGGCWMVVVSSCRGWMSPQPPCNFRLPH